MAIQQESLPVSTHAEKGRPREMGAAPVSQLGRLRRRLLGIPLAEATFARRRFRVSTEAARARLERVGHTFLQGYHAALEEDNLEDLAIRLNRIDSEWRGFAFEGAAMGLSLLDRLTPWRRNRWTAFVEGPGAAHVYMVHVGIGWVLARLHRRIEPALAHLDPLLRWLVVDGYGFHQGYFHGPLYLEAQAIPPRLTGYAQRAFDQGLGRSLWFLEGGNATRIPAVIAAFPLQRQADLWSGIGLAAAYAGGVEKSALQALWELAGPYQSLLAQGAAFAAKARQRADNPAAHTELACAVLCGMSADAAAHITDAALENLSPHEPLAYEIWRGRIQARLASSRR